MKISRMDSCDVPTARWVSSFLGTLKMRPRPETQKLDHLFKLVVSKTTAPYSSDQSYIDLATICLLAKESTPWFSIAAILGIATDSVESRLSELCLDGFFGIPETPEKPLTMSRDSSSFISFIINQGRCPDIDHFEHVTQSRRRITRFYLDYLTTTILSQTAETSTALSTQPSSLVVQQENSIPSILQVALAHWLDFALEHSDDAFNARLFPVVQAVLERYLFHWIGALALFNRMHAAVPSLQRLQAWLNVSLFSTFLKLEFILAFQLVSPTSTRHIKLCVEGQEMLGRFYDHFNTESTTDVLTFLPSCTLRDIYQHLVPRSSPIVDLPLRDGLSWSSYPQRLIGHSGTVTSATFTANTNHVVSGSEDCTIRVWERKSCMPIRTLRGHTDCVRSIAVTSDGTYIVSGSDDTTVRIWDFNSGRNIRTLKGHTNMVFPVAVSRDARWIASGSHDKTVRVWDLFSGRCSHILMGHSSFVLSVTFSPNSNQIISGSHDHSIRVWDTISGTAIRTLDGHTSYVTSINFTADGDHIVSGSNDNTIRLWDAKTGACTSTFQSRNPTLNSVTTSSDSKHIISGSVLGTVRLWDLSTSSLLDVLQTKEKVESVAISPDGAQILTGGAGGLFLWDFPRRPFTPLKSVEFTSDGRGIKATFTNGKIQELGIGNSSTSNIGEEVAGSLHHYYIMPHRAYYEDNFSHIGEVYEELQGVARMVGKVPISLFKEGSHLIYSGRHVVLWHEVGDLLHLDFSNCPP